MHFTWNRRILVIAFEAALVGVGLLATPFEIVGIAQSSQEAAVGS